MARYIMADNIVCWHQIYHKFLSTFFFFFHFQFIIYFYAFHFFFFFGLLFLGRIISFFVFLFQFLAAVICFWFFFLFHFFHLLRVLFCFVLELIMKFTDRQRYNLTKVKSLVWSYSSFSDNFIVISSFDRIFPNKFFSLFLVI